MRIVWDEPKRIANRLKHGLDFADLSVDFFDDAVVVTADNGRFRAIGQMPGGAVTVVFARLGSEGVSIVSMRPASRKERKQLPP